MVIFGLLDYHAQHTMDTKIVKCVQMTRHRVVLCCEDMSLYGATLLWVKEVEIFSYFVMVRP